jgi:two-component system, NtrC family, sensor kinase
MSRSFEPLREQVARIVESVIDQTDADAYEETLRALLLDLPESIETQAPLHVNALREEGADDALIGRILLAIQAECIEIIRAKSHENSAAEMVGLLRACIGKALPPCPVDSRCIELVKALEREQDEAEGDKERLVHGFYQCVADTFREMVYAHDVNGTLIFVNDAGLEMLNYERRDIYDGMSIYAFVVPDYNDLVESRLENPGAIYRSPFAIEVYGKDGDRVPMEFDARPFFDDKGEVVAVIGIARDMRLERRLQEKITRSYADLDNLFRSIPIGVVMTDEDGRIRNVNPAAVSLCGAGNMNALMGLPVQSVWELGDERASKALQKSLATMAPKRLRYVGKTRFGQKFSCDMLMQPMLDEQEAVTGLLILLVDVSEQHVLQQSLIQSEKLAALGEIMAGVAHELNNPLTGVLGYAQLLLEGDLTPVVRERLDQVAQEAQRCKRIVENLLIFSRRQKGEKVRGDLTDLLRETLSLREYQLGIDDIALSVELAEGLPKLFVDPGELRQVFLNLINNAQQALTAMHDRQRELLIRSFIKDDEIHIQFEDNGPGIPAQLQSRVFDPFFSTREVGAGTGLGLSVAYGILQDHDGRILLESEENVRTVLTVVLPVPG